MERDTRMWRGWIKSRELVLPEILSELGEDIPGWIPSREREFSQIILFLSAKEGLETIVPRGGHKPPGTGEGKGGREGYDPKWFRTR